MADALLALRDAIKSQAQISYADATGAAAPTLLAATSLVLPVSPPVTLAKSTPTRFRKSGAPPTSTDPSATPNDFFTVEAVYLAWLLREAPGAEYMKQARESGLAVGFVSVTERKGLVDWLEGRVGEHPQIIVETTTPVGSPARASAALPSSTPRQGAAETSSSPTKRRYVVDTADAEAVKKIKANEVELRDRNTVLRGVKANNFSAIRGIYTEKLKKLREGKPGATGAPQTPLAGNMYPIIMISSSPTALITMHNVKRFLAESIFEPSQDARARAAAEGNPRPEDLIAIYRTLTTISPSGRETSTQARYFVVDSVEALGKFGADAWERVVCVMTTGQAWQFRPYKWNEPRTLFHHVKGVYVSWANEPPNKKIQDWNVTELKIDPIRRHVDKSVVAHFWKILDTWTMANKPWLMKA
ncbi:hypothetical protein HWV62_18596 [Athelia sp. TMB]|nr:hypothetical protein HWV62_18596 [Athelia sp. TMB]